MNYNTIWYWPELKCAIPVAQVFLVYFVPTQIPVSHSSPVFLVTPVTKNTDFAWGLLPDVGRFFMCKGPVYPGEGS